MSEFKDFIIEQEQKEIEKQQEECIRLHEEEIMNEKLNSYRDYLLGQKKSIRTAKYAVQYVRKFLKENNLTDMTNATTHIVMDYFAKIQPCSQAKLNLINWSLRGFFSWANITGIEVPHQKQTIKKFKQIITEHELLEIIDPDLSFIFPRNYIQARSVIFLIFYTGITTSEFLKIKRSDFNLEANELNLRVPNSNILRKAPLTSFLVKQLRTYFDSEIEKTNAFNLNQPKFNYIFRLLNESQVLGKGRLFSPVLFRDSYCYHCLSVGLGLRAAQQLMNHSEARWTMKYLDLLPEQIKAKLMEEYYCIGFKENYLKVIEKSWQKIEKKYQTKLELKNKYLEEKRQQREANKTEHENLKTETDKGENQNVN